MLVRAPPPLQKKGYQKVSRPYRCAACHPLHFLAQHICEFVSLGIIPAGCVVVSAFLCNKIG